MRGVPDAQRCRTTVRRPGRGVSSGVASAVAGRDGSHGSAGTPAPASALRGLGSRGYAGLTLDELAGRSGVAKTTILRRWPSKAAVAAAGVERLALQSVDVPDSG